VNSDALNLRKLNILKDGIAEVNPTIFERIGRKWKRSF